MAGPTEQFFLLLAERMAGSPRAGTIRFDLARPRGSDHWLVGIDSGGVRVSRGEADADCVVRADRALFDRVASGRVNAMAALLRGELAFEGDPEPLVALQRMFPAPPHRGSGRRRTPGSGARP